MHCVLCGRIMRKFWDSGLRICTQKCAAEYMQSVLPNGLATYCSKCGEGTGGLECEICTDKQGETSHEAMD